MAEPELPGANRRDLRNELEQLLRGHGLETLRSGEWIMPGGRLPGISASCEVNPLDRGVSARLDVPVLVYPGRVLLESCGGAGGDENGAIRDALSNFCQGTFHVFLAAFWGLVEDDQVTLESWPIAGATWRAVVGNFVNRSFGGAPVEVPDDAFDAVENALKATKLEGDLHWVRTYYCNMGTGEIVIEALLDNETWPAGEQALGSMDWPASEHFYSVRNFFMIQREREAKPERAESRWLSWLRR